MQRSESGCDPALLCKNTPQGRPAFLETLILPSVVQDLYRLTGQHSDEQMSIRPSLPVMVVRLQAQVDLSP